MSVWTVTCIFNIKLHQQTQHWSPFHIQKYFIAERQLRCHHFQLQLSWVFYFKMKLRLRTLDIVWDIHIPCQSVWIQDPASFWIHEPANATPGRQQVLSPWFPASANPTLAIMDIWKMNQWLEIFLPSLPPPLLPALFCPYFSLFSFLYSKFF